MEIEVTKSSSMESSFDKQRHIRFLEMMFDLLPSDYQFQEINHLTLAYFSLSSLHLLHSLHLVDKEAIASWVLSFQIHPTSLADLSNGQFYGFVGSRSSLFPHTDGNLKKHNNSHLASTYCALAILKIIGYDFSSFDSQPVIKSMINLQRHDGSFMPIHIGAEADLRFVYCAAAISYMLNDWNGIDKEKAKDYILSCQSYDGAFGLSPGLESHGGATYCAVASLRLMGFMDCDIFSKDASDSVIDIPMLLDWLVQRQAADGGCHGRPNKPSDTCYGFWVGGILKILGGYKFIDNKALRDSLLTCQSKYGGFSKFPGQLPELYHSFYGFAAFSLLEEEDGLNSICVELGITHRAGPTTANVG